MGVMPLTVWVDDWQLQCCGDPFAIGDEVAWSLTTPHLEWLTSVLGPQRAAAITHAEEHHGRSEDAVPTRGRVLDIATACCGYTKVRDARGSIELQHRPDTGELHPVIRADGSDTAPEGLLFLGYIVELEAYAPPG